MERKLVLDISHWDGDISLESWKIKRKLWGVIIKAGGHESGLGRYRDSKFEENYRKAKAAGLHIGSYYYSVTTDASEARGDADHFASLLAGKKFDMPVYIDVEDPRQFALSRRQLTDIIKTFCNRMKEHGFYPGLYTGGSAWLNNMYPSELRSYADWIAWWRAAWPSECGDIGMWQQGGIRLSDGHIVYGDEPGYHDCDWCVVDYPSIIKGGGKDEDKGKDETGTADAVIKAAEGELGYYAPSDPERGSKYGRWMAEVTGEDWMAGPSVEIWWCCMFVSWCLNRAGVVVKGFPNQNTDQALAGGARNYLVDKATARRGDIVIFDWNWATDSTDHIGIVTSDASGGYIDTIEGNVSNSVKRMRRALSQVRYCIRPQYADGDKPEPAPKPGKLEVDGVAGFATVTALQKAVKASWVDGIITGQYAGNRRYMTALASVEFDGGTGSDTVRKLQQLIGAEVDGVWGKGTSTKLQKFLQKRGYDIGTAGVDGYFGADSCRALQRCINDGKFN